MKHENQLPPLSVGARVAVALLSLFILPISIGCLLFAHRAFDSLADSSWASQFFTSLFGFVFTEFFAASTAFLLVMFLWASFRPTWVERLLLRAGSRVGHSILLLFCGIFIPAVIGAVVLLITK